MTDEKRREDEASASKDEPTTPIKDKGDGELEAQAEAAVDSLSPEAIARRVAAFGEEDATERLAREEERKLAERRQSKKKGKKGGGLEVAASKKLAKIGTRAEPKRTVAVATDADPLIEQTAKLGDWAKKNQTTVQIVGAAIAAGLLGVAGFMYYGHKRELQASELLSKAVAEQRARIGDAPKEDEENDNQPVFKTHELRRDAALNRYRDVQAQFPKTGAAILSRLGEGSMLLDKREADAALAAFNDVKGSPLAAADLEVRGRALEGMGFSYELKAQANADEAPKLLDEALNVYRELENVAEVKGFKELAMYHQARVLQAKGDTDKAKEILVSLKTRFEKPEDGPSTIPTGPTFPFLREVAMDRLREIDPSAAPKQATGPGGGPKYTEADMKRLIEEAQKKGLDPDMKRKVDEALKTGKGAPWPVPSK